MLENDPKTARSEPSIQQQIADAKPASETAETSKKQDGKSLDAIFGVKLEVRVVLGRNRMPISELLNLTKGSVIELDRRVGEPVDLMINDRMVARGDLVRVQGDMLGVALREIVKDFVSEI